MYVRRHAENAVRRLAQQFGAVLVTGARQVGKTTMLHEVTQGIHYVTLDDPVQLSAAKGASGSFLRDNLPPIVIDEVQYAPELFPHIKMSIDKSHAKGQFYLTWVAPATHNQNSCFLLPLRGNKVLSGSQQFQMMENVTESLAGRLGVVNLPGLSLREQCGSDNTMPFLSAEEYYDACRTSAPQLNDSVI
ncbi:MAG: AAA family ATPase [Oscillospiraceae bacterium]|jgi:predicted AAA+ superfamily ATPase|nr:AAA family ATPase [Oscillospiraceae bacterium]